MSSVRVDVVVDRARTRLGALEHAVERLRGAGGSAQSPDGRITARVDGSGALADLHLQEAVCGTDPRQLAASILEVVHEAAHAAAADRVVVMDRLREELR